jgi:hypothetical protein
MSAAHKAKRAQRSRSSSRQSRPALAVRSETPNANAVQGSLQERLDQLNERVLTAQSMVRTCRYSLFAPNNDLGPDVTYVLAEVAELLEEISHQLEADKLQPAGVSS